MTVTPLAIAEAADLLASADAAAIPIPPITRRYPGLGLADAYAIQQVNLARRLADSRTQVGHKIGLTSAPMQALLGVDEPDFGYILDDMVLSDGAAISRARLCAPRVEPEVAFLLRKPLRGPGIGVAQVRAATEAIAVALEVVDSRIANWELTLRDTVADNASSGAVAIGEWVPLTDDMDLAALHASLHLNGVEIDTGAGSAVLGDPAAAVAWLANALAPFGADLQPGQFVMSGSFTAAAFVHAGDAASTTISGLGTVSLRFI